MVSSMGEYPLLRNVYAIRGAISYEALVTAKLAMNWPDASQGRNRH